MEPSSKAICVLGMHRSGTSLITKAIYTLGAYVGEEDDLVTPIQDNNPEGFWEYIEFVNIQERILESFGLSWDTTRPLPMGWTNSPISLFFRKKLKSIICNNFANKNLWAWKDPRTCLLLPLWQEILEELNIEISYVIAFRNPLDVMASLEKRDGIDKVHSEAIWYNYTLSLLYSTLHNPTSKKVCVQYDEFLNHPLLNLRKIHNQIGFNEGFDINEQDIRGLVKPNLRHSYNTLEDLEQLGSVSTKSVELYRICLRVLDNESILNDLIIRQRIIELYDDLQISSNMDRVSNQIMQVFFSTDSCEFMESNSLFQTVMLDRMFHKYEFTLPAYTSFPIRIDPVTGYFSFEIRSITIYGIKEEGRLTTIYKSSDDGFNSIRLVNGTVLSSSDSYIAITIDDPQLYLPQTGNSPCYVGGYKVIIEMCVGRELFPNISELLHNNINKNAEILSFSNESFQKKEEELKYSQKELEHNIKELEQSKLDLVRIQKELDKCRNEIDVTKKNNEVLYSSLERIINEKDFVEKKNTELLAELSNSYDINYNLEANLKSERNSLNQLMNSKSWKLTKPLRIMFGRRIK